MKVFEHQTFAKVYKEILTELLNNPEYQSSPRGSKINEILNASIILHEPVSCMYMNERRSSQFKYICAEFLWYLTGDNNVNFISQFSKFWKTIANDDGTLNSAYGNLIFKERYNQSTPTQWQWAYKSLIDDKDSRQSLLHFNKPYHQWNGNKDFVCTMYGIFSIRNNALNFTVHMRSNDVILGLPTDIPFFVLLQLNMWNLLKKKYPDLMIGTYTHNVNSLHLYERNIDLVNEMILNDFTDVVISDGSELLIDEIGNTTDFIKSTKSKISCSGPFTNPTSKFEQFINKHLFGDNITFEL